jgi:hypothetical protein
MKMNLVARTLIAGLLTIASSAAFADGLISNIRADGEYVATSMFFMKMRFPQNQVTKEVNCHHSGFLGHNKDCDQQQIDLGDVPNSTGQIYFDFFEVSGTTSQADRLKNAKETLSFSFLGDAGTSLGIEFQYSSDVFSEIFLSKSSVLKTRSIWTLKNCDGQSIESMNPADDGIEDAIAHLRRLDLSRYMNCTLALDSGSAQYDSYDHRGSYGSLSSVPFSETSNVEPLIYEKYQYERASRIESAEIFLKANGDIELHNGDGDGNYYHGDVPRISYFKPTNAPNPEKQEAVFQSTKRLVSLIKSYGNVLVSVANSGATTKSAAQNAWINKNKNQFLQLLSTIESNLPGTSSVDKLNTVILINQAYSYVRQIEDGTRAAASLDDVVASGN